MKTYESACLAPSDINQHLPVLLKYAQKCESITEFGLGVTGNSIMAFLKGCPKVTTYDIENHRQSIRDAEVYAASLGRSWTFKLQSSTKEVIDETDFLFIDAEHSYPAVLYELEMQHEQVKKYIGFHDVVTFGHKNEFPDKVADPAVQGILLAVFTFLKNHPQWKVSYYSPHNNGLLILEK